MTYNKKNTSMKLCFNKSMQLQASLMSADHMALEKLVHAKTSHNEDIMASIMHVMLAKR